MRRFLKLITLIGLLLMTLGIPVMAASQQTAQAQVGVATWVDITIAPCGSPLDFGTYNPNEFNKSVQCQTGVIPAVLVTNTNLSSVSVDLCLQGTDWAPVATEFELVDSNTRHHDESTLTDTTGLPVTQLTTTLVKYTTAIVKDGGTASLWYWLDIPVAVPANTYTSTFTFKAVNTGTSC